MTLACSKDPCSPQECYLESDQTSLYHAAKGLMTLQALYGTVPQIFGKGECARVRNGVSLVAEGGPPGPQKGEEWRAIYKQGPSILFIWEFDYLLKFIRNPQIHMRGFVDTPKVAKHESCPVCGLAAGVRHSALCPLVQAPTL